jgi:hypothetical protein
MQRQSVPLAFQPLAFNQANARWTFRWWRPKSRDVLSWRTAVRWGDPKRHEFHALFTTTARFPYGEMLGHVRRDQWEQYEPLTEEPALFRNFANIAATEGALLQFALKYGPLGIATASSDPLAALETDNPNNVAPPVMTEGLETWLFDRQAIRRVLAVLDALRLRRWRRLADWIRVENEMAILDFPEEPPWLRARNGVHRERIASAAFRPELYASAMTLSNTSERTALLAREWVSSAVNQRLAIHGGLHAFLAHNDLERRLEFRVVPTSLAGAIWLQCAESIQENRSYRKCLNCPKWLLVSTDGGRRESAEFCTDRCRLQHWRKAQNASARKRSSRAKAKG